MRNRSELAGVLAHEIAHVHAGHYERLSRSASLGTVPALAAIILSGGNPAVLAGALALLESYQLAFSREMETEADRLSLIYLRRTSYDPRGLIGALQLIEPGERLVPVRRPRGAALAPADRLAHRRAPDGLASPPGEEYRPAPDPAWDRVRAILLALDDPEPALREFGARGRPRAPRSTWTCSASCTRAAATPRRPRRSSACAVAAAPGEARYAIDLATALWALGDGAGAHAEVERALRLPGRGGVRARGPLPARRDLRAEGARSEALARYRRATELSPQLPEAHYQLALGAGGTGALGEADFHFGAGRGAARRLHRRPRELPAGPRAARGRTRLVGPHRRGAPAHAVSGTAPQSPDRRAPCIWTLLGDPSGSVAGKGVGGDSTRDGGDSGGKTLPGFFEKRELLYAEQPNAAALRRAGARRAGGRAAGARAGVLRQGRRHRGAGAGGRGRARRGRRLRFEAALKALGQDGGGGRSGSRSARRRSRPGLLWFAYRAFEKADHQDGLERTRRAMFEAGIAPASSSRAPGNRGGPAVPWARRAWTSR